MSTRYPIFLDLTRKSVLIAGGGTLALQKLRSLEHTDATITVIAPELRGDWPPLGPGASVEWKRREYESGDVLAHHLIFAATDDAELNHRIVTEARAGGLLANAVDDTAWCDFFTPAIVQRGRITLAISTDGGFPGISRAVRELLDEWLPQRDDALIDALFAARAELRQAGVEPTERSAALRKLVADFRKAYLDATAHSPEVAPHAAES